MDLGISEQQEMLLYKACKDHNGILPATLARDMYSSKSSAHSAIDKLELAGYIEKYTPGYWKVVKITNDIKEELADKDVSSSQEVEEQVEESESDYEIEAV